MHCRRIILFRMIFIRLDAQAISRISFRQICTCGKNSDNTILAEDAYATRSSKFSKHKVSALFIREHFPELAGHVEGMLCVYVVSCILSRDRTHPRARACARKGTCPRPEYFIFTYQRWALCVVYIKSQYSYGISIRQGLHPSRHFPAVLADIHVYGMSQTYRNTF